MLQASAWHMFPNDVWLYWFHPIRSTTGKADVQDSEECQRAAAAAVAVGLESNRMQINTVALKRHVKLRIACLHSNSRCQYTPQQLAYKKTATARKCMCVLTSCFLSRTWM